MPLKGFVKWDYILKKLSEFCHIVATWYVLVGSQKSEVGSRRSEVGSRKSEVRSQRSEVGSRKSEVGSRKSEVGSRKNPQSKRAIQRKFQVFAPLFVALRLIWLCQETNLVNLIRFYQLNPPCPRYNLIGLSNFILITVIYLSRTLAGTSK